jgi:hypothetical protein
MTETGSLGSIRTVRTTPKSSKRLRIKNVWSLKRRELTATRRKEVKMWAVNNKGVGEKSQCK